MKLVVTYTLTDISDDQAFFDTKTEIVILTENKEFSIKADGGGEGKLVHDLNKKYPIKNTSDMTMNLEIKYGGLIIISKSKTKTLYQLLNKNAL